MKIKKEINYYHTLGVDHDSSPKEIKKAYWELSKQYHPDKNGGDDTKFKEILEAYKILTNEELRNEYDCVSLFGKSYDPFRELYEFEFSNENTNTDQYQKDLSKYKQKELIDILIKLKTFQENIEYERWVQCKMCNGTGMDFSNRKLVFECDPCEGTGIDFTGNECPMCKGGGETSFGQCGMCSSEKVIKIKQKIKIKKKDFKDGKLKLPFMGNKSVFENKVGCLYVLIEDEVKDEDED